MPTSHAATRTSPDYPVVDAIMNIVVEWWKRRGSELFDLPAADVERIARDLAVSPTDLRMLDRSCAALLLPKMLQALKLDPALVARSEPEVLRDLQRVCALCEQKKRCASELEGNAAESYEIYCPNAATLKALS